MTGQELINYIEEGKLQDKHFFIDVEGYFSTIDQIMENECGDIILSEEGRSENDYKIDRFNFERYYSEWFNIISLQEAKQLWYTDKNFTLLREDGSDSDSGNYKSWEEIVDIYYNERVAFGVEK